MAAARLNPATAKPLVINIHKTPGSSRVGSGANPCSFVPMHYFSAVGVGKDNFDAMAVSKSCMTDIYLQFICAHLPDNFDAMQLDWRDVSTKVMRAYEMQANISHAWLLNYR